MTVIVNELELVAPPEQDRTPRSERERRPAPSEPAGPRWGDLARALARRDARLDRVRAH